VNNSNANKNKQLIPPSIAENAACAANGAPFLTLPALFLKIIFNFSFFATPSLFCFGTLLIGAPAAD
jgi:hypothetical protein